MVVQIVQFSVHLSSVCIAIGILMVVMLRYHAVGADFFLVGQEKMLWQLLECSAYVLVW